MDGRHAALIRRYYPGYRSPKRAYEETLDAYVQPGASWLDLGCGRQLSGNRELNAELGGRAKLIVGCDRDFHLRRHMTVRNLVRCDATALPFRDGSFDLITACMVAEHLPEPARAFAEVARLCKPSGAFVVFTPNKWNYAMLIARLTPHWFHLLYKRVTHFLNRGGWESFQDDVFPTFYRANTVGSLRRLLEGAGLTEARISRLALAHSFGFVRPLFILSLLLERAIDWPVIENLKADILAVFVKPARRVVALTQPRQRDGGSQPPAEVDDREPLVATAGR